MLKKLQLIPREEKFYDYLEALDKAGNEAIQATIKLLHVIDEGRELNGSAQAIRDAKARAKAIREEITNALCNTFITPLDREDIQALSQALYKVPKTLEKLQERLLLYSIRAKDGDIFQQMVIVERASKELSEMVHALRNAKNAPAMDARNRALEDLELEADNKLTDLLRDLYATCTDPVEVIKRKDLYDLIEKVIDKQRDAGHIILEIFLKHT